MALVNGCVALRREGQRKEVVVFLHFYQTHLTAYTVMMHKFSFYIQNWEIDGSDALTAYPYKKFLDFYSTTAGW